MPLGTKVGIGLSNIVLDADPGPPQGAQPPHNFQPVTIVAKQSPNLVTAEHLLNELDNERPNKNVRHCILIQCRTFLLACSLSFFKRNTWLVMLYHCRLEFNVGPKM